MAAAALMPLSYAAAAAAAASAEFSFRVRPNPAWTCLFTLQLGEDVNVRLCRPSTHYQRRSQTATLSPAEQPPVRFQCGSFLHRFPPAGGTAARVRKPVGPPATGRAGAGRPLLGVRAAPRLVDGGAAGSLRGRRGPTSARRCAASSLQCGRGNAPAAAGNEPCPERD